MQANSVVEVENKSSNTKDPKQSTDHCGEIYF